ncbi:MAG: P-loop NTPase [Acidobacteriota bacterium]
MKKYRDLAGDGGSNIVGQVIRLKEDIASSLQPLRHRLAVGSGKGGVGKSTLTMLLALALKDQGRRPVVLDADLNGPSQARLGGLSARVPVPGRRGLAVPLTADGIGVVSMGTVVPETEQVDFPSLSQGDSYVWRASKEFSVLSDFLARTDWSPFDTLLLDLPPGTERTFQYAEFLGPETAFLLVTIPSDVSRGVVRRSVAALSRTGSPLLGYVENMKGYYCSCCRRVRPLFPDSGQVDLGIPCLGSVPFDPDLAALCDQGLSLEGQKGSAAWKAIQALCDEVNREFHAEAQRRRERQKR